MAPYTYIIVVGGWVAWMVPFIVRKRSGGTVERRDRRARWGIVLEGLGYSLLWQNAFWARSPGRWRVTLSVVFLIAASVLSWFGAHALGRQWRFDAALDAEHELVASGAYRIVRHPIYLSMLCLLLGTGAMITPLSMLVLSTGLFLIGTEIRVRVEDALLELRFGDEFRAYQRDVAAYIPFLR
jgi:protein-S-isoprenylcysteine O-methyltransferase Ste14